MQNDATPSDDRLVHTVTPSGGVPSSSTPLQSSRSNMHESSFQFATKKKSSSLDSKTIAVPVVAASRAPWHETLTPSSALYKRFASVLEKVIGRGYKVSNGLPFLEPVPLVKEEIHLLYGGIDSTTMSGGMSYYVLPIPANHARVAILCAKGTGQEKESVVLSANGGMWRISLSCLCETWYDGLSTFEAFLAHDIEGNLLFSASSPLLVSDFVTFRGRHVTDIKGCLSFAHRRAVLDTLSPLSPFRYSQASETLPQWTIFPQRDSQARRDRRDRYKSLPTDYPMLPLCVTAFPEFPDTVYERDEDATDFVLGGDWDNRVSIGMGRGVRCYWCRPNSDFALWKCVTGRPNPSGFFQVAAGCEPATSLWRIEKIEPSSDHDERRTSTEPKTAETKTTEGGRSTGVVGTVYLTSSKTDGMGAPLGVVDYKSLDATAHKTAFSSTDDLDHIATESVTCRIDCVDMGLWNRLSAAFLKISKSTLPSSSAARRPSVVVRCWEGGFGKQKQLLHGTSDKKITRRTVACVAHDTLFADTPECIERARDAAKDGLSSAYLEKIDKVMKRDIYLADEELERLTIQMPGLSERDPCLRTISERFDGFDRDPQENDEMLPDDRSKEDDDDENDGKSDQEAPEEFKKWGGWRQEEDGNNREEEDVRRDSGKTATMMDTEGDGLEDTAIVCQGNRDSRPDDRDKFYDD